MPNWCSNGITLRHADPAMIDRVEHPSTDGILSEFMPTPQELMDTTAGSFGDPERQALLEAQQKANIAKYGYKDWYDWNIANWGIKWDIDLENVNRVDEYTVTAAFESAWSPPIEAYKKLEELGFEVEAFYNEPGIGFAGKYSNGVDECVEYAGANSNTVRELVGEELDDYFELSEMLAEWEEMDKEDSL